MGTVRAGTCAWSDHERFYPPTLRQQDRLSFYAKYFSVVEIDSSYHGIPRVDSVHRWIEQTPPEFVFDIKAYRSFTQHDRGDGPSEKDIVQFQTVVDALAESNKLGLVLLQFPPWFVRSDVNQSYVEQTVRIFEDYPIGIEFRQSSWWESDVVSSTLRWLTQLNAVNVVCDEPQTGLGTIPFVPEVTSKRLVAFRLHGRNAATWYQKGLTSSSERFDYLYSRAELQAFLPYVKIWSESAQEVHILMNNNQGDYAVQNAFEWNDLLQLGPRLADRPARQLTLWDEV